jgi:hypothetical protein
LVDAHISGRNGVASADMAARLTQEVVKLEAKLDGVATKISEFPATKPAPKVVLEKKVAIVPAAEASRQAKESLSQAKTLIQNNQFGLALEKLEESEEITSKTEAAVSAEETAATPDEKKTEEKTIPAGEVQGESSETQPETTPPPVQSGSEVPVTPASVTQP